MLANFGMRVQQIYKKSTAPPTRHITLLTFQPINLTLYILPLQK